MEFHLHQKVMHIKNGKLITNRNISRNVTAKGDHVYGFDGKKKINRWLRKSKRMARKTRKTRRIAKGDA